MKTYLKICSAVLLSTSLLLGGCTKTGPTTTETTRTVSYQDQSYTIPTNPSKVVALSNSISKMIYAVGGKAIARVESNEKLPSEIESLPSIGHTANPNMEQLVGLHPDLVLGLPSQHEKFKGQLDSNNIPSILINYDGINDNIPLLTLLGNIFHTESNAAQVIESYNKKINTVKSAIPKDKSVKVAVLRATGKSVTAETPLAITASMIHELGITNVVEQHLKDNVTSKTVPYSLETLTVDNPDIILVVTMGKKDEINATFAKEMTSNPAWNQLQAVKNDKVIFLPSQWFLLNPGLETPEAMAELVKIIYGVKVQLDK